MTFVFYTDNERVGHLREKPDGWSAHGKTAKSVLRALNNGELVDPETYQVVRLSDTALMEKALPRIFNNEYLWVKVV